MRTPESKHLPACPLEKWHKLEFCDLCGIGPHGKRFCKINMADNKRAPYNKNWNSFDIRNENMNELKYFVKPRGIGGSQ